ncbi:hypothetical protein K439DRAFT_1625291 [Ramaria rubella]|nr:hypothetical protein K439DRAFT_1625291 [Ramaria rubella]
MVKGKLTRRALRSAPTAEMSRAERASARASKKVAPNTASAADQATANSASGTLPVRKKGSDKIGKPSVDTEIISVHSSSLLVNSFFFLGREPVTNSPSPSKKSRKHLQGVIPTSDEEPQGNITATNEGGWSDDSSLCGFIVDDNASLEIMTDLGNEYLSSGETL